MSCKRIGMIAHDERKQDMLEWLDKNAEKFVGHDLFGTGTTCSLIKERFPQLTVTPLKSGPLGGDQQIGAMVAEGKLDMLFFLIDPMTLQPHDVDIKALLRLAVVYNIPAAYNKSTADFLISSPYFTNEYERDCKDYSVYLNRNIKDVKSDC